jgi:hypothetical protein
VIGTIGVTETIGIVTGVGIVTIGVVTIGVVIVTGVGIVTIGVVIVTGVAGPQNEMKSLFKVWPKRWRNVYLIRVKQNKFVVP